MSTVFKPNATQLRILADIEKAEKPVRMVMWKGRPQPVSTFPGNWPQILGWRCMDGLHDICPIPGCVCPCHQATEAQEKAGFEKHDG